MNLKGGVIVIGSLIWEDHLDEKKLGKNFIRRDWRTQNLQEKTRSTPAPIRYGKESTTRNETYTMIFSKGCESSLGQGLICEFQEIINSFENLERQSIALAIAEGIYTTGNPQISCSWGSVGLLMNPALVSKNKGKAEFVVKKWSEIYTNFKKFESRNYLREGDIEAPINQNGLLTLNWQAEMNDFDLLLATPVVPKPRTALSSKEIAERMIEKEYDQYFKNNWKHGLRTFQDDEIIKFLH